MGKQKEILVYDVKGSGKIKVDYDGTITCLKIDNKLSALTIWGPHQNIYNLYLAKGDYNGDFLNSYLKHIDFDFYADTNFMRERSTQIEQLLAVFEPGAFYIDNVNNFSVGEIEQDSRLIIGDLFGGEFRLLFTTKELGDLDRTTINVYKQRILKGDKPIIIAYRKDYESSETGESFLIDGHHKLVAYKELKVKPFIWEIVNIEGGTYDELDQSVCKYLNHQKIESLKYFYMVEGDSLGNVTKLKNR